MNRVHINFSLKKFFLTLAYCGLSVMLFAQSTDGVGIGTTDVEPDAILQIDASDRGVLIPRITTTARTSMSSPVSAGLIVYDSELHAFYYHDGSNWIRLIASPAKQAIDLAENKIINLANGTSANDAVNKSQLDTKLNLSGGTMSGAVNMGAQKITDLANGTNTSDAVNRGQLNAKLNTSGGTMTGAIDMGNNKITGVGEGTNANDAINKAQLDEATESVWGAIGGSSSSTSGVRTITLDLGSSKSRKLNITAWSDMTRTGSDDYITLNLSSRNLTTDSWGLLIQRNFRPGVQVVVAQESMHFTVTTSNRYLRLRVTPEGSGTVKYYGIKASLAQ